MKYILLISFLTTFKSYSQNSDSLFYNEFLLGVKEENVRQRIIFIKGKTDSFLFKPFSKSITKKFFFAFPGCTFGSDFGRLVYFTSIRGEVDSVNDVINNYQFDDESIRLHIQDINVYYNDGIQLELRFLTNKDRLIIAALKKIYNNGYLEKVKRKIKETKLQNYFTQIDVDEKRNSFNIIIKDKKLPHNFFVL